jgi:exopolysaccharide biosynthesis polyprenyl glycosylphosphotransferase
MYKRSELFFNVLLIPLDFVMIVASFVVAYLIRTRLVSGPIAFHPGQAGYLKLVLIVAPIWLFIFAVLGLYNYRSNRGRFEELGRVIVAVSASVMTLIVWEYASKKPVFPSRSIPIYALGLGILLVSIGRLIAWSIQHLMFRKGVGVHRILLLGHHQNARILAGQLSAGGSGQQVVGMLDDSLKAGSEWEGLPVLGRISDIEKAVSKHQVDELIVTDPEFPEAIIFSLIAYADARKINFRYAPTLFGIYNINTSVTQLAGVPLIELKKTSLEGWGRVEKRLLDIFGSTFGLVILSPILLFIACAIKLDSRGPIFYRHERIGRGGRVMKVIKFRTMRTEFSTGSGFSGKTDDEILKEHFKDKPELAKEFAKTQKIKDDPRVTRVGKFLRKSSLDEFPQLFNVISGEMTLVGPRPVTKVELARYGKYQHMVLSLKPGVTGLWQVSGRSDVSYEERVRLDSYYVENWSLWLDISTIIRTLKVLIKHDGAY